MSLFRTSPQPATGSLARVATRLADQVLTVERLALGRVKVGTVMLAAPRAVPTALGVDSATSARVSWAVQMLGAREVALGLGTWIAVRRGDDRASRLWIMAGLVSDATDALVVGSAVIRGRVSKGAGAGVVAIATTASAVQLAALSEPLDPPR